MDVSTDVGLAVIGGMLLASLLALSRAGLIRYRATVRAGLRAREALAAATEASFEQEWFAPDILRETVDDVLAIVATIWAGGELEGVTRSDSRLIERWARSVLAWMGDGVRLAGEPSVQFLRVINRPGELEDRVVLRVRFPLRREHRALGKPQTVKADLRWTLGRAGGQWQVLGISSDPLAGSVLDQPSISDQGADQDRLRELSLLELGDADTPAGPTDLSQLISPDAPPPQQLTELAQMDGRFDPDLLNSRIGHIVEAWEEASTGSAEPLTALSSPDALEALLLLNQRKGTIRLIVRDAVVESWKVSRLVLTAEPVEVEITLTVSAVRYVISAQDGTHLGGSVDARNEMYLGWTLALTGPSPATWQLIFTTNPAEEIPGMRDLTDP